MRCASRRTNLSGSCQETSSIGNVLSSNRYAENVTSTYTDCEGRGFPRCGRRKSGCWPCWRRPRTWRPRRARKERLADVRYGRNPSSGICGTWTCKIRYSTVLDLDEVEISPDRDRAATFGESSPMPFSDGLRNFRHNFQRFILNLTEALPSLILLAVIVVVVVVIVRRCVKKSRAKKGPQTGRGPAGRTEITGIKRPRLAGEEGFSRGGARGNHDEDAGRGDGERRDDRQRHEAERHERVDALLDAELEGRFFAPSSFSFISVSGQSDMMPAISSTTFPQISPFSTTTMPPCCCTI